MNKKIVYTTLTIIFMLVMLKPSVSQTVDLTDSLITAKKEFKKNENIEFLVKLDNSQKSTPNKSRMVATISCACNNTDFYYTVYRIEGGIRPNRTKKVFRDHSEKPDAKKCQCKTQNALFSDNTKRFIPAINEKGKYIIEIKGYGFTMYSNVFSVVN